MIVFNPFPVVAFFVFDTVWVTNKIKPFLVTTTEIYNNPIETPTPILQRKKGIFFFNYLIIVFIYSFLSLVKIGTLLVSVVEAIVFYSVILIFNVFYVTILIVFFRLSDPMMRG